MKHAYEIRSKVFQGGGILSRHRTLEGAERKMKEHDRAIRRLNRNGGQYYHDCTIYHAETGQPVYYADRFED